MRKYFARASVAAAAMLMSASLVAGAQAQVSHQKANHAKGFMVRATRDHHKVSYFVERSHHRASAHSASCPAGQFVASYCSPPVEQNLFGAYAWNDGGVTFGSTNSSTCRALGYNANACGVYTTVANTLIVAYVGADGPYGAQSITVSCKTASGGSCPVTFHKVNSENAGGGDSEVWYADATSVISQSAPIFVTATAAQPDCGTGRAACDVSLQAVTYANAITPGASGAQATGIGASSDCYSKAGAPTCSLTTTEPDSQVWAAANNPSASTIPTWAPNQFAVGVSDPSNRKTFYSQFLGACASNGNGSKPCTTMTLPASGLYQNPFTLAPTATTTSGTKVTINDSAPTTNPYNMVEVEIL